MSTKKAYVTAVVAGAMTAGIAAANVVATPPDTAISAQPSARDVDLAASITIPIIDIDTPGPVSISRLLSLTLEALPNSLKAILDSEAGTVYNLPGLHTDYSSSGQQIFSAVRHPGESVDFGFESSGPETGVWSVLGVASGSEDLQRSRQLGLSLLTGGTEGIGAALGGTLAKASVERTVSVFDSGIDSKAQRIVGDFGGQLSVMPFDGFKAVGDATLIQANRSAQFKLGSLQLGAGGNGTLGGDAGLCLGSGQTGNCANKLAFASLKAPIQVGFGTGGSTNNVFDVNVPTNLAVAVGGGQFSVDGDIGGTVKVGSVTLGRVIPINIQIPGGSSMLSSASTRQQQSVRDSFMAVPQKSASDNETGGRHRAPLRDAVNTTVANIKTAVDNAVQGKHAAKGSED